MSPAGGCSSVRPSACTCRRARFIGSSACRARLPTWPASTPSRSSISARRCSIDSSNPERASARARTATARVGYPRGRGMTQRQRATSVALVLLVTIASIWLAAELPPQAFYSGDSGVKLIAARNAIAHPSRPFEVDLPEIDGRPVPYVERFFAVHGQHAHALQSPLFPVLSAPLIAVFGLRGAYILPLISFVADRKSTRLNSSHGYISYAVFCLKK